CQGKQYREQTPVSKATDSMSLFHTQCLRFSGSIVKGKACSVRYIISTNESPITPVVYAGHFPSLCMLEVVDLLPFLACLAVFLGRLQRGCHLPSHFQELPLPNLLLRFFGIPDAAPPPPPAPEQTPADIITSSFTTF